MNGTEWVDTVVHMRPYWVVRTLSGISMDIGMSLLVINLMMTALARPSEARQPMPRGVSPRSGWRAGRMTARFVALVAGVFFFFLAVFTQGILPLIEPSARTTDVTAVVRTDLGQLKWMRDRGHRLHAAATTRAARVSARGLLVLPFPVRSSGDRRDAPLGSGERGRRICL